MRITIEHTSYYRYATPATYSVQSLRLTPPSFSGQQVIDWQVGSDPVSDLTATADGFGNLMHLMTIEVPHQEVVIRASGTVEVEDRAGIVQGLPELVPPRVFLKRTALTMPDETILALAGSVLEANPLAWLHALMVGIRAKVDYRPGTTDVETNAAEALAAGEGVCQDHAHIFIAAARSAGVPARYITGYLLTGDPDGAPAHHAWAEALVDGLGWVGFDAANAICPNDQYVRMTASLDARHAAPIRGSRRGGDVETLQVTVRVHQQQNIQQ